MVEFLNALAALVVVVAGWVLVVELLAWSSRHNVPHERFPGRVRDGIPGRAPGHVPGRGPGR